jgi:hypothetical protein
MHESNSKLVTTLALHSKHKSYAVLEASQIRTCNSELATLIHIPLCLWIKGPLSNIKQKDDKKGCSQRECTIPTALFVHLHHIYLILSYLILFLSSNIGGQEN